MEDMPPGFRFYPTEEELVSFYLHNKLGADRDDLNDVMNRVIPVVDIYDHNPWDLPQFSAYLCHNDPEQCRPIGVKRTMVFYSGRAPNGKKTEWKMNEYKAIQGQSSLANATAPPTLRQEFSLCRICKKSKCLRSFDRRPPPGILKIEEPILGLHNNHANQATQTEKTDNLSTMADAGGDEYLFWDVDGFWNPVDQ
ncbi:hypothetical protein V6N12_053009 [Hibiscus sabdariffa]|uniref:NAC domain-containing protein n=1 Tax=Hibiscus sabdariffa TaxID=183260 RepID=A0ABR2ABV0_9ROSI